jgi:aspartate ammonia-lyase
MRASWSQSLQSAAALLLAVFLAGNSLWCQQSTQTPAGPTRTEKDLLGEKQVPANAYYGVQTLRALENFQL